MVSRVSGASLVRMPGGGLTESAILSFPGSARVASAYVPPGGGATSASPGASPAAASSRTALSITRRAIQPYTLSPNQCSDSGASETRPRCGLSPNRPQGDEGEAIEHTPSQPETP